MKNIIFLEFEKIKKGVILATLISTVYFLMNINSVMKTSVFENSLEVWINGMEYIAVFFPLIVVIPTCWLNYYESKNKFISYTFPRVSKRKILKAKVITCLTCSFSIIFFTIFIGGIVSVLFIKPNAFELVGSYTTSNIPIEKRFVLGNLLVNHPIIYVFLQSVWCGILSMIISFMGFILSLYSKNLLIILIGPFIYTIIENFIISTLGFPKFRLVASFDPHVLQNVSLVDMLIGPIIAIFATIIIYMCYKLIKVDIYNI